LPAAWGLKIGVRGEKQLDHRRSLLKRMRMSGSPFAPRSSISSYVGMACFSQALRSAFAKSAYLIELPDLL
jgi:hypothetical protein